MATMQLLGEVSITAIRMFSLRLPVAAIPPAWACGRSGLIRAGMSLPPERPWHSNVLGKATPGRSHVSAPPARVQRLHPTAAPDAARAAAAAGRSGGLHRLS
ncbi:MAG: hypothetical protein ACKO0M_14530 [Cyanobium sp.]